MRLIKRVVPYCAVFLAAFLLNILITRLFFGSSDYLQNQIYWGRASIKDCFHAIAGHVVKAFTGYGSIFYHPGLGVLALFDLILLLIFLSGHGRGKRGGKGVILFFYLALLATPFLMTVLLGGTPAMRSQMVLPAVTGFLGYLGIWLVQIQESYFRRRLRGALIYCCLAVCLLGGVEQAKVTGRLYYTDWCRYEQDAALGRSVIEKIEQIKPDERMPVVVIGGREFSGNHSCVTGEVIGRSFFNYDREVEPVPFWSTRRILGFLHTLGADYAQVPQERMGEAMECGANMPVWPAEGCVQVKNGMIIVKLSSD